MPGKQSHYNRNLVRIVCCRGVNSNIRTRINNYSFRVIIVIEMAWSIVDTIPNLAIRMGLKINADNEEFFSSACIDIYTLTIGIIR